MSTSDLLTDLAPGRPIFDEATDEGLDRLWAAVLGQGEGLPRRSAHEIGIALAGITRSGW